MCGTRKDGTRYLIAQVGDDQIDGQQYYRYYYADVLRDDNSLCNPTILYSDTNVARLIDAKNFNKYIPRGYEEAVDNILFSRENIFDSKIKGTGYIGKVMKEAQGNQRGIQLAQSVSDISKPIDKQKKFQYPTKVYVRDDRSTFIAQKMDYGWNVNDINVIPYHIFEIVNENGTRFIKRNIVYTERDFFQDRRPGIANDYLSRERLNRKVKEAGGYIGYYDEKGIRRYNPHLVEFFKNRHKITGIQSNPAKNPTSTLSLEGVRNRRKRVEQFIDDYKASSLDIDGYRFQEENENIQRVINAIRIGKIDVSGDLNIKKRREDLVMGKVARLLIEADNITIDETQDYLEKFISIPEINSLLLRLRNSESVKQMQKHANENRRNGRYPHQYRKTPAEEMRDRKRKQNRLSLQHPVIASDGISGVTPMTIKRSTSKVGLKEIDDIALSTKNLQNQPLKDNQQEK